MPKFDPNLPRFDGLQHHQSREANLMGALASVGDELTAVRTLGTWPLAPEARTTFVESLREKARSILLYSEDLEGIWRLNG